MSSVGSHAFMPRQIACGGRTQTRKDSDEIFYVVYYFYFFLIEFIKASLLIINGDSL